LIDKNALFGEHFYFLTIEYNTKISYYKYEENVEELFMIKEKNVGQEKLTISNNIKFLLSYNHKTRKEVCKDLDIKYTTFCDWVNGRVAPSYTALEKLGNYFDIEAVDFFSQLDEAKMQSCKRIAKYASHLIKGKVLDMKVLNSLDDDQIKNLISSGFKFRHRSLDEYVELAGGSLVASPEFDWGEPMGDEIW